MECEIFFTVNLEEIDYAERMGMDVMPEPIDGYKPFLIDVSEIKAASITEDDQHINLFALNETFTIKYTQIMWDELKKRLA